MGIIKLLKIELWRMIRSKSVVFYYLVELLAIILPTLDNVEATYLPLTDIHLTQYMGISLTIRYVYSAVLIGSLFSNDVENGVIDTYIAVGMRRTHIVISKLLCSWCVIIFVTSLASISYIGLSFIINGVSPIPSSFCCSICLSFITLFVHTLLLVTVDLLLLSPVITVFCSVFSVISAGLFPYDIAKWFYVVYNNPISVLLYEESTDIIRMIAVITITGVSFMTTSLLVSCRKK